MCIWIYLLFNKLFLFDSPGLRGPDLRFLLSHDKRNQKRAGETPDPHFYYGGYYFALRRHLGCSVLNTFVGAPVFCGYPRVLSLAGRCGAASTRHCTSTAAPYQHHGGKQSSGLAPNGYTNSTPKGQCRQWQIDASPDIGPWQYRQKQSQRPRSAIS